MSHDGDHELTAGDLDAARDAIDRIKADADPSMDTFDDALQAVIDEVGRIVTTADNALELMKRGKLHPALIVAKEQGQIITKAPPKMKIVALAIPADAISRLRRAYSTMQGIQAQQEHDRQIAKN